MEFVTTAVTELEQGAKGDTCMRPQKYENVKKMCLIHSSDTENSLYKLLLGQHLKICLNLFFLPDVLAYVYLLLISTII